MQYYMNLQTKIEMRSDLNENSHDRATFSSELVTGGKKFLIYFGLDISTEKK